MVTNIFCLAGKTALVTGASGGLGAHFATILGRAGASVVVAARRKEALAETADHVRAAGATCQTVSLDVTCAESIAAIEPLLATVDILINNAGIAIDKPLLDQDEADWDQVLGTNAKGMFLMTQVFGRARRAQGVPGAIVNIASILGLRQASQVAPYAVSKAAAIQLTKVSALELARFGIRVNCLCPGYIATGLNREFFDSDVGKAMLKHIPQRRLGEARELDGPLLLLASDASSYMSGSVLVADGGHIINSL